MKTEQKWKLKPFNFLQVSSIIKSATSSSDNFLIANFNFDKSINSNLHEICLLHTFFQGFGQIHVRPKFAEVKKHILSEENYDIFLLKP